MKLIGFIKEHDDINGAQDFIYYQKSNQYGLSYDRKIIEYLKEGVLVLGWMGYIGV